MGQFGSLADNYTNKNNDHNGWIATNFKVAEDLTLHGQLTLTEASSSFSGLHLDDSVLPGTPPGFNYTDISELEDFSNLRMRWWYFEAGLRQLPAQRYALEYDIIYNDYNDHQPYIVNATGSRLGMQFRLNFLFYPPGGVPASKPARLVSFYLLRPSHSNAVFCSRHLKARSQAKQPSSLCIQTSSCWGFSPVGRSRVG